MSKCVHSNKVTSINDILLFSSQYLEPCDICRLSCVSPSLYSCIFKYLFFETVLKQYPYPINSFLSNSVKNNRISFWDFLLQINLRKKQDTSLYYCCKVDDPSYCGLSANGVEGEILKDISRSYPLHPLFRDSKGLGQRLLGNILRSCSLYNKTIGYCQGMNFVAGMFLLLRLDPDFLGFESNVHDRELMIKSYSLNHDQIVEDCFWEMICLMDQYKFTQLWMPGIPGLTLCIYLFDRLLKTELNKLREHFLSYEFFSDYFVAQWFMTIFISILPPQSLCIVWDIFFVHGWCFLYKFSIGILKYYETSLLTMDMPNICKFLSELKNIFHSNPSIVIDIIKLSNTVNVTPSLLKVLEDDYNTSPIDNNEDEDYIPDQLVIESEPLSPQSLMLRKKIEALSEDISNMTKVYLTLSNKESEYQTAVEEFTLRKEILQKQLFEIVKDNSKQYDEDIKFYQNKLTSICKEMIKLDRRYKKTLNQYALIKSAIHDAYQKKQQYCNEFRNIIDTLL